MKLRELGEKISPAKITSTLNPPEKAAAFSQSRIKAALEEMQRPIGSIIAGVRGALSAILFDLPKKVAKKTLGTVTKIITGAIAFPANLARGTMDLALKVPLTAALGLASVIPEQTVGRISRLAQKTKEKVLKSIGEEENQSLPKAA